MSYTEIYKFTKSGKAKMIGEVKNAWRGAMAIWNTMEGRYLPPFIPDWAKRLEGEWLDKKYHRFATASSEDPSAMKEIWALFGDARVPIPERIVLGATFDKVVVMKKDIPNLIGAFRNFNGDTSLNEQADIIEGVMNDNNLIAIAFNQTSVSEGDWAYSGGVDSKGENKPYNILKQKEHWNLFEDPCVIGEAKILTNYHVT